MATKKTKAAARKPAKAGKTKAPKAAAPKTARPSKVGAIVEMMKRSDGATLAQMMKATGWQAHSVRGAIAGNVKKKLGHEVASTKAEDGERTYKIG